MTDPHEELLAHLQSLRQPAILDEEQQEVTAGLRDYGRKPGRYNCYSCKRFKSRPSTVCPHCGDDPVSFTNDEYYGGPHAQMRAREQFDLDEGWIPPTYEQQMKGLLREPERPPVQRVERPKDDLDDLAW